MRRIAPFMLLLALAGPPAIAPEARAADDPSPAKLRVYVGTYTGPKSRGIYLMELDTATGALTPKGVAAETPSPSFLAIHPNGKYLYAANEVGRFEGKPTGSVSAFAIDPKTGMLDPLNQKTSGGADPCYVAVDPTGRVVLAANYSGGSVEALPIGPDGKLGDPSALEQHVGSSVDKSRQSGPHAHSVDLDASGKIAVSADLGLDKLLVDRLDPAKGTLAPVEPSVEVAPGSGPRHFTFHPDGKHGYAINEMASTVTVYNYDPARATLAPTQTISSRATGGQKGNSTAEILVHPSGKFVYGSNRGDDNLAIYSVDPASGKLTLVGHQSTFGKTPRNFGIDPSGRFLIAANQDSGTVVVFRVDPATGKLDRVGDPVPVPSPVCVKFLAVKE